VRGREIEPNRNGFRLFAGLADFHHAATDTTCCGYYDGKLYKPFFAWFWQKFFKNYS
jgi:hypothetical protein